MCMENDGTVQLNQNTCKELGNFFFGAAKWNASEPHIATVITFTAHIVLSGHPFHLASLRLENLKKEK